MSEAVKLSKLLVQRVRIRPDLGVIQVLIDFMLSRIDTHGLFSGAAVLLRNMLLYEMRSTKRILGSIETLLSIGLLVKEAKALDVALQRVCTKGGKEARAVQGTVLATLFTALLSGAE